MRPGFLYFSIFTWLVFTGGRFTAPFLQNVAGFDDTLIGITFAIQILLFSFLSSIGGIWADKLEFKYPEKGRIGCLAVGTFLATISFEIHGIVQFLVKDDHTMSTVLHITARLMYASCSAILFPILDGITLSYLKKHSRDATAYGQERLFGAVAWAIASMLVGPILDSHGFDVFFWSAPVGGILCIITFLKYANDSLHFTEEMVEDVGMQETEMVENTKEDISSSIEDSFKDVPNPTEETNSLKILWSMTRTFSACGFIFSAWTLNMGTSVVENLIFLYFETLGGTNTICGLTVVVTVLFEIPIFHYAPQLLAYFGADTMQKIACFAYIIRVIGYTFVPQNQIALVLLFEPLHGVTYACSKTSSVEFAARITPDGYEASVQGLLSMILGFGSVAGVLFGGWIEDVLGPKVLYRSYAGIVALGLGIFYIALSLDRTVQNARYKHLPKKQSSIDVHDDIDQQQIIL
mmetsp:Transcript_4642/g.7029  ORF Transcript_4642/g.7029 Transcript_4642/m.7029 type:complete len:464 (+) Transcript_4642:120-1511(+)